MRDIFINGTEIQLIKGDITKQKTDAVVNAANSGLMGGGGVDGAIHRAGGPSILNECKSIISRIGRLQPGKAVITTGGNLPAKYVIHTVGPIWHNGKSQEAETLASCYTECLRIAIEKELKSISFPAISTGAYGYPLDDAAKIAVSTVINYLSQHYMQLELIVFVLFDDMCLNIFDSKLSGFCTRS